MGLISRQYVFSNGTDANADHVNYEIDTIVQLLNGMLDSENIAPRSITNDRIKANSISQNELSFVAAVLDDNWSTDWTTYSSQKLDLIHQEVLQLITDSIEFTNTEVEKLSEAIGLLLDKKANVGDSYTKDESDDLLNDKISFDETYLKEDIDLLLAGKTDIELVYTKEEMDALLSDKQDEIYPSTTQPDDMPVGKFWLDTHDNPYMLYVMTENGIVLVGGAGGGGTVLNDNLVSTSTVYSSQKSVDSFSPIDHTHDLSDLENGIADLGNDLSEVENNLSEVKNDLTDHLDSLNPEFVSIEDFGASTSFDDNSPYIQDALDSHYNVYIPEGTWKVKTSIKVPSNRHLKMHSHCVILRNADIKSVFINKSDGTAGGWNASENITIEGGTLNGDYASFPAGSQREFGLVVLAHTRNSKILGTTFKNMDRWHMIEVNSSQNILIEKCRFMDYVNAGSVSTEAIQIDGAFGSSQLPMTEGMPYDNTVCNNITIRDCDFERVHHAIGSHSGVANTLHRKIRIEGNRVRSITGYFITAVNWEDVVVANNLIEFAAYGVYLYLNGANSGRITVRDNQFFALGFFAGSFDDMARGIAINSSATHKFNRVFIVGNILSQVGRIGIGFDYSENVVVRGNSLQTIYRSAIWSYGAKKVFITDNIVEGSNIVGVGGASGGQNIRVGESTALGDKGVVIANNRFESVSIQNSDSVTMVQNMFPSSGSYLPANNTALVNKDNINY